MEARHEFASWRELLGKLIKNPQEKRRLAHGADIKPITLTRWAEGKSQPREENLLRLAHELAPDVAAGFLRLAEEEFPSLVRAHTEHNTIASEINTEVYAQVLQTYAKMPSALARQHLQKLILDDALKQLDPTGVGMVIALFCCVPPRTGEKIRALCQIGGFGTPPWQRDHERKNLFVGAESVAGMAVSAYRVFSADSRADAAVNWEEYEESAAAAPILRQARIAGALVASSARPYHFTQAHKDLVELYAHLVALIFSPAEFYDSSEIQLGIMPEIALQTSHVQEIDRRTTQKLSEIQARGESNIAMQQARQSVWQDIVSEFLERADQG